MIHDLATPLLTCSPEVQADLGEADYSEFEAYSSQSAKGTAKTWNMLATLSAYAGGTPNTEFVGLGRSTPLLEPFLFVSGPSGKRGRKPDRLPLKPQELPNSYVALSGLYAYMERQDEIVLYGFGAVRRNTPIELLNARILSKDW